MPPTQWPRRIGVALEEERLSQLLDQVREALESTGKGQGKGGKKVSPASAQCVCCGSSGHYRKECKQRFKVCNHCGIAGHLASVCRSAAKIPKNMPKERVPGVSAWFCPRCDCLGECGLTACQKPGCGGKRKQEAPIPPVPKPYVPASSAKSDAAPAREVDATVMQGLQATVDSLMTARQVLVDGGTNATLLDAPLAKAVAALQSATPKPPTLLDTVHAEQSRLAGKEKLMKAMAAREAKHLKSDTELQLRISGLPAKRAEALAALEAEHKARVQSTEEHYVAKEAQLSRERQVAKELSQTAKALEEAELLKFSSEEQAPAPPNASPVLHVAQPGTPEGARQSPFSQCDFLDAAGQAHFLVFLASQKERMRKDAAAQEDGDEFMEPPAQDPKANARNLEDADTPDPKRVAK
jgi:hypothetical protein